MIRNVEYGLVYVLASSDDWVQAAQMLFEADKLRGEYFPLALALALRLHCRFLGCRIGFDEDENLAIQYDIYRHLSGTCRQNMWRPRSRSCTTSGRARSICSRRHLPGAKCPMTN